MFSRVSLYFREREGEGDREGRKAEGANVSESVVSHFSHLFPLFLLPYRAPLLSGWRCDWQVRGEKTLSVFLRLDKRIFPPLSSSSFSVILRYFCWKKRGGWNKRRRWCRFGVSNQTKEQRILPKLTSRRRLLPGRRRS